MCKVQTWAGIQLTYGTHNYCQLMEWLPPPHTQHQQCIIRLTVLQETSSPSGEHKFKVGLVCVVCMCVYVCESFLAG